MAVLLLGGRGGDGDKAACEALRDAQGDDSDIYDDHRGMDLSDELRSALAELGRASAGEEISPEVFERWGTVMRHCAEQVSLSAWDNADHERRNRAWTFDLLQDYGAG